MTAHMHHTPSRAKQCCGNCDAFVVNKQHALKGPQTGACCAGPPSAIPDFEQVPGSPVTVSGPAMRAVVRGVWPPVSETQWCRGWQYKDTADDDTRAA
jgi:hypothetical protein